MKTARIELYSPAGPRVVFDAVATPEDIREAVPQGWVVLSGDWGKYQKLGEDLLAVPLTRDVTPAYVLREARALLLDRPTVWPRVGLGQAVMGVQHVAHAVRVAAMHRLREHLNFWPTQLGVLTEWSSTHGVDDGIELLEAVLKEMGECMACDGTGRVEGSGTPDLKVVCPVCDGKGGRCPRCRSPRGRCSHPEATPGPRAV